MSCLVVDTPPSLEAEREREADRISEMHQQAGAVGECRTPRGKSRSDEALRLLPVVARTPVRRAAVDLHVFTPPMSPGVTEPEAEPELLRPPSNADMRSVERHVAQGRSDGSPAAAARASQKQLELALENERLRVLISTHHPLHAENEALRRDVHTAKADLTLIRASRDEAVAEAERKLRPQLEAELRKALKTADVEERHRMARRVAELAVAGAESAERIADDSAAIEELEASLQSFREMMLEIEEEKAELSQAKLAVDGKLTAEQRRYAAAEAARERAEQEKADAMADAARRIADADARMQAALQSAEAAAEAVRQAEQGNISARTQAAHTVHKTEQDSAAAVHRASVAMQNALREAERQTHADRTAREQAEAAVAAKEEERAAAVERAGTHEVDVTRLTADLEQSRLELRRSEQAQAGSQQLADEVATREEEGFAAGLRGELASAQKELATHQVLLERTKQELSVSIEAVRQAEAALRVEDDHAAVAEQLKEKHFFELAAARDEHASQLARLEEFLSAETAAAAAAAMCANATLLAVQEQCTGLERELAAKDVDMGELVKAATMALSDASSPQSSSVWSVNVDEAEEAALKVSKALEAKAKAEAVTRKLRSEIAAREAHHAAAMQRTEAQHEAERAARAAERVAHTAVQSGHAFQLEQLQQALASFYAESEKVMDGRGEVEARTVELAAQHHATIAALEQRLTREMAEAVAAEVSHKERACANLARKIVALQETRAAGLGSMRSTRHSFVDLRAREPQGASSYCVHYSQNHEADMDEMTLELSPDGVVVTDNTTGAAFREFPYVSLRSWLANGESITLSSNDQGSITMTSQDATEIADAIAEASRKLSQRRKETEANQQLEELEAQHTATVEALHGQHEAERTVHAAERTAHTVTQCSYAQQLQQIEQLKRAHAAELAAAHGSHALQVERLQKSLKKEMADGMAAMSACAELEAHIAAIEADYVAQHTAAAKRHTLQLELAGERHKGQHTAAGERHMVELAAGKIAREQLEERLQRDMAELEVAMSAAVAAEVGAKESACEGLAERIAELMDEKAVAKRLFESGCAKLADRIAELTKEKAAVECKAAEAEADLRSQISDAEATASKAMEIATAQVQLKLLAQDQNAHKVAMLEDSEVEVAGLKAQVVAAAERPVWQVPDAGMLPAGLAAHLQQCAAADQLLTAAEVEISGWMGLVESARNAQAEQKVELDREAAAVAEQHRVAEAAHAERNAAMKAAVGTALGDVNGLITQNELLRKNSDAEKAEHRKAIGEFMAAATTTVSTIAELSAGLSQNGWPVALPGFPDALRSRQLQHSQAGSRAGSIGDGLDVADDLTVTGVRVEAVGEVEVGWRVLSVDGTSVRSKPELVAALHQVAGGVATSFVLARSGAGSANATVLLHAKHTSSDLDLSDDRAQLEQRLTREMAEAVAAEVSHKERACANLARKIVTPQETRAAEMAGLQARLSGVGVAATPGGGGLALSFQPLGSA